jgi:1,5-anhydro-D-fructose reductase (1,5-anhydro-D-mannitol-forming)
VLFPAAIILKVTNLRWLVVGIGDITRKRVIPAILTEPRSELYGVVTRDPAKAAAYPRAQVWTSLNDALTDPAVDAVYVASPVALHAEQSIAALRAGKHLLCEKPVAMDYAQAQSMIAASREYPGVFGIAYYRRLYPKMRRARELIAEGAIGRPVLAQACNHGWLESEERGWLRDPSLAGGGPLYDSGSHRLDAFNFLFGKPSRATGLLSNVVHQLGVEDSATVIVDYESGARAVLDSRWNSRIVRDEFRVIGTDGEIELTPLNGPELRHGGKVETLPACANVHFPLIENFVAAVLDGGPLACPAADAIWVDWITEKVKTS